MIGSGHDTGAASHMASLSLSVAPIVAGKHLFDNLHRRVALVELGKRRQAEAPQQKIGVGGETQTTHPLSILRAEGARHRRYLDTRSFKHRRRHPSERLFRTVEIAGHGVGIEAVPVECAMGWPPPHSLCEKTFAPRPFGPRRISVRTTRRSFCGWKGSAARPARANCDDFSKRPMLYKSELRKTGTNGASGSALIPALIRSSHSRECVGGRQQAPWHVGVAEAWRHPKSVVRSQPCPSNGFGPPLFR